MSEKRNGENPVFGVCFKLLTIFFHLLYMSSCSTSKDIRHVNDNRKYFRLIIDTPCCKTMIFLVDTNGVIHSIPNRYILH